MNTRKFTPLGAAVLVFALVGCRPQVEAPSPFPWPYATQWRRPTKVLVEDRPVVEVIQSEPVPLEVLDVEYDPRSEMTIRDVVLGIRHVKLAEGHTGVVLRLQPGGDYIDVLAGSTRYLADHEISPGIGDPLMVTGSVVRLKYGTMLLARELVWRRSTLQLRDETGRPLWHANYNVALW